MLGALLAVQDEDLRRDQLLHRRARLSERSRLDDLGRQLVDLAGAATALSAEREAARRRQQEIDGTRSPNSSDVSRPSIAG